ncbi:MAG: hypothetical protein K9N49_04895, partial [Candidatus Marinimicrobia bacterium]|nr:hypothetical protein [Candidatus Neomarinimicrobiota bacterium]
LKKKMHRLMRHELRATSLALGSLAIGAGVTVIESVCTGQVYVPTLVLILQGGRDWGRAAALLVLYNLMFVLPLILIFWLTYRGLEMPALLAWSRRHVVPGKLLLAAFFLALAALLLWL